MITLSSCLIGEIISFILPPNEYGCVYVWTTQGNITIYRLPEDADFGKKNYPSRWNSFWSWVVCKQANLSHLGHRKPARIHRIADAPKMGHCLVRSLVQTHNWAIFLRKWVRRGRYSQWRSLSGHVERIFVDKIEDWTFGFNRTTLRAAQPKLHSMFCALFVKITLSDYQNWCRWASSRNFSWQF